MSADVERTGPRRFQAWCPQCEDGTNGTKRQADTWADAHNETKHQTNGEAK